MKRLLLLLLNSRDPLMPAPGSAAYEVLPGAKAKKKKNRLN